jgi:hypothetical protein
MSRLGSTLPVPTALAAALALLLATACGDAPPPSEDVGARPPAAPAAGSLELRYAAGRVNLVSEQALQVAILEALAQQADFELVVGQVEAKQLTLRLDHAPLLDAISALLAGVTFRAEYRAQEGGGAHELKKLVVGRPRLQDLDARSQELREAFAKAQKADPADVRAALARRIAERETGEGKERMDALRERLERRRTERAQALEQLAADDAAQRADAVAHLDAEGELLPRISELAKSDPDAAVRAAAVERLGDADTFYATSALLDSLADPSPVVLVAALEALESAGDESMLGRIEPLLAHPDPNVREAASETLDSLR